MHSRRRWDQRRLRKLTELCSSAQTSMHSLPQFFSVICNVVLCYERCETSLEFLLGTASVFVSAAFTVKCPWSTLWLGGERLLARLLHLCLLQGAICVYPVYTCLLQVELPTKLAGDVYFSGWYLLQGAMCVYTSRPAVDTNSKGCLLQYLGMHGRLLPAVAARQKTPTHTSSS